MSDYSISLLTLSQEQKQQNHLSSLSLIKQIEKIILELIEQKQYEQLDQLFTAINHSPTLDLDAFPTHSMQIASFSNDYSYLHYLQALVYQKMYKYQSSIQAGQIAIDSFRLIQRYQGKHVKYWQDISAIMVANYQRTQNYTQLLKFYLYQKEMVPQLSLPQMSLITLNNSIAQVHKQLQNHQEHDLALLENIDMHLSTNKLEQIVSAVFLYAELTEKQHERKIMEKVEGLNAKIIGKQANAILGELYLREGKLAKAEEHYLHSDADFNSLRQLEKIYWVQVGDGETLNEDKENKQRILHKLVHVLEQIKEEIPEGKFHYAYALERLAGNDLDAVQKCLSAYRKCQPNERVAERIREITLLFARKCVEQQKLKELKYLDEYDEDCAIQLAKMYYQNNLLDLAIKLCMKLEHSNKPDILIECNRILGMGHREWKHYLESITYLKKAQQLIQENRSKFNSQYLEIIECICDNYARVNKKKEYQKYQDEYIHLKRLLKVI